MLRQATAASLLALGLARDPGCGSHDHANGGPNAPCTRSADCGHDLVCTEGVCREPDAGTTESSGDAGHDGG